MSTFYKNICFIFASILMLVSSCSIADAQRTGRTASARSAGLKSAVDTKRFLPKIASRADFDSMARVYNAKTSYALPHAMFIIDRGNNNKIYYVNSQMYKFHQDFANAMYLSLKRSEDFYKDVYANDKRRLIVGTVAWQEPVKQFTFEFWEGDQISADLMKLAYDTISKSFFEKISYKPNSTHQEDLADTLEIPKITGAEITKNQEYLALNSAKGVGRIHVIDKLDDTVEIGYNEILVLKTLPLDLPPVAGIIVSEPSSPLSHINLLAKGWNIPNAYIKNANELYRKFDTYWFEFEATPTEAKFTPCLKECLDHLSELVPGVYGPNKDQFKAPPSNLDIKKLALLSEMRAKDSIVYGSKSANLGEVMHAKMTDFDVPNGFGIPFVYYKKFMESNGFDEMMDKLMGDLDFVHNPSARRKKLAEVRDLMQKAKVDDTLRAEIVSKWKTTLGGKPVFVRSSSNAEDGGKFSGAGLYSSVNNVTDEDKIIEAVKTVWASIWNFKAYEARERNFVKHDETYMSVLIQTGVAMDNGGVMITKDPYNPSNKGSVYISSTFGHNMAVTQPGEGMAKGEKIPIPEQILFTPATNTIQVLTRSDQTTMFVPAEGGGMKEVPFSIKRRVLNDLVARSLVKAAREIKKIFGGADQDIEWGIMKSRLYIVQSRPYIDAPVHGIGASRY